MKLYLLTSGSYSDYAVEGIYTDRARAEAAHADLAKVEGDAVNDIQEWESDQLGDDPDRKAVRRYRAEVGEDGTLTECPAAWTWQTSDDHGNAFVYRLGSKSSVAYGNSWISQAHANKIAIEKYQEWLRGRAISPRPST